MPTTKIVTPESVTFPPSNKTFAEDVGCHWTTSSRIRNGHRLPSLNMLERITRLYDQDPGDALWAAAQGPDEFGHWVSEHVFQTPTR